MQHATNMEILMKSREVYLNHKTSKESYDLQKDQIIEPLIYFI